MTELAETEVKICMFVFDFWRWKFYMIILIERTWNSMWGLYYRCRPKWNKLDSLWCRPPNTKSYRK